MNRNLFLIISIFLSIIGLLLAANIVIIGDKIGQVTHVYVEYAFYALILILAYIYLLRPIIKIHRAPEFPVLSVEESWDADQMSVFAKRLASNCNYIDDVKKRKKHQNEFMEKVSFHRTEPEKLKILISNEIDLRMNGDKTMKVLGINTRIKEWAKSVAMVTAISQNGKFDTVAVMVMNYKMISDIIKASGFRPTKQQLFKIYVKVLTTALVTYCTSQVFSEEAGSGLLDFFYDADINKDAAEGAGEAVAASVDDIDVDVTDIDMDQNSFADVLSSAFKKLPVPLVGSVLQGAINGLLTLRIGFVTKAYLTEGPKALTGIKNKRRVKRQAMREALNATRIPTVAVDAAGFVTGTSIKGLAKIFR